MATITIIGGGVIGSAIRYEFSKDNHKVLVLESNTSMKGKNQSFRNSGVIHSGIYYPRESMPLKAKLCVEGNRLLYNFAAEHNIPHRKTGKLIVATNEDEEATLRRYLRIAKDNKVQEVKIISGDDARKLEPNVDCIKALYVPSTGIIEPKFVVIKLNLLSKQNSHYLPGNKVTGIKPEKDGFALTTASGDSSKKFTADILINAAGLYSDEIARMVNPESPYEIEPVRGEYAVFSRTRRDNIGIKMNVYPVPYYYDPKTGKRVTGDYAAMENRFNKGELSKVPGIHLTPTLGDYNKVDREFILGERVMVGPTATVGVEKEDYASKYPVEFYPDKINNFFPNLKVSDLTLHQTGIRAKLKGHQDFVIERDSNYPNMINLIGIESPGLTAALAIAKYVKQLIN